VGIPHYVVVEEEARLKIIKSFSDSGLADLEKWSQINQRELGR
jgi:hypothetical protein